MYYQYPIEINSNKQTKVTTNKNMLVFITNIRLRNKILIKNNKFNINIHMYSLFI